ncbi:conserved hypothetical protein [delta proteobacterium NaphS2]|nr:conserved hypothetical protein [delta proteobacterium NaphS2]
MVVLMEMGQITPPVGINVFIIGGVADDIRMQEIFKGILPFLLIELLLIILLVLFPDIAMFLPDSMGGLAPLPQ